MTENPPDSINVDLDSIFGKEYELVNSASDVVKGHVISSDMTPWGRGIVVGLSRIANLGMLFNTVDKD